MSERLALYFKKQSLLTRIWGSRDDRSFKHPLFVSFIIGLELKTSVFLYMQIRLQLVEHGVIFKCFMRLLHSFSRDPPDMNSARRSESHRWAQVGVKKPKQQQQQKPLATAWFLLLWAGLILSCVWTGPFETSAFLRELLCVCVPWQGVLASLWLLSHIRSLAVWPSPWQLCQQHPLCFLLCKSASRGLHVQIFLVSRKKPCLITCLSPC